MMNASGLVQIRDGKSYYYNTISNFIEDSSGAIIKSLIEHAFGNTDEQIGAWINQINSLKEKLAHSECTGCIIFEYDIIRLGKRIDVVLLIKHMVFSIEFKNGATQYLARDAEQAEDYALDLKNFHKESEDLYVCPILVATEAKEHVNEISSYPDKQVRLQFANDRTLMDCIKAVYRKYGTDEAFSYDTWYNSAYCPTPTIVEAAVEAYANHTVKEIAHSEAGQADIDACEKAVSNIVEYAKKNKKKCICFITGVPGAGKTLVGLDIAAQNLNVEDNTKSVYLSGNGPLVKVLRKALMKDVVERRELDSTDLSPEENEKRIERIIEAVENGTFKKIEKKKNKIDATSKKMTKKAIEMFIQDAYAFRKEYIARPDRQPQEPLENVLIFDEAQRCWSKEKLSYFMKTKMKIDDYDGSEPACFVEIMNRKNWSVLICLVGLGQDIYDGEVGVNEWFRTAIEDYSDWEIFYSNKIFDQLEDNNIDKKLIESCSRAHVENALHLQTSIRSFRSKYQSKFVDNILACNSEAVRDIYKELKEQYPVYVTRNYHRAQDWVRSKVRGSQRCGVVACSSAQRLKPEGIYVPTDIDVENWFLAPKEDLRSSNALEVVASEFKVQGLELDYCIVCWDADLRKVHDGWEYYNFRGTKWVKRRQEIQQRYLINAYRVLLTRARQGMVIFIPKGVDPEIDATRSFLYYDAIYDYLVRECGISVLD